MTDHWFHRIVTSHGWYQLAPFQYEPPVLRRIHRLPDGRPLLMQMRAGEGETLSVTADIPLSASEQAAVQADAGRMFSQHWALDEFHALLAAHPRYAPAVRGQWGRLLVGATVWEDLVKTLLTTNTTWAQTRQMTARVCAFGPAYNGGHAFPTPHAIALLPDAAFAQQARLGYRAAALHGLARQIVGGLDVESWRTLEADALYRQVIALRGFGDYAASTMLRLLGHFGRLAIDTECRAAYRHLTGRATFTDADIRAHYAPYGRWQGLINWIDIMHRGELTP